MYGIYRKGKCPPDLNHLAAVKASSEIISLLCSLQLLLMLLELLRCHLLRLLLVDR